MCSEWLHLADNFPDSIYLIRFVPTISSSSDRSRDKSFGFFLRRSCFFFLSFYCSERIFISLECCVPCRAVCVSMANAAPSRHKASGNHFEISKNSFKTNVVPSLLSAFYTAIFRPTLEFASILLLLFSALSCETNRNRCHLLVTERKRDFLPSSMDMQSIHQCDIPCILYIENV